MLVIIGYLVVLVSVFGGYALAGGHFGVLFQPVELLIIGGAAVGAFITANDSHTIIATLKALPKLIVGSKNHDKALGMELLAWMYVLLSKARKDGMMTLESDVDDPRNSAIFAPYPIILKDAQMLEFLTDYLRLIVGGHSDAFEISGWSMNSKPTSTRPKCRPTV